jgi:hypothetical protein
VGDTLFNIFRKSVFPAFADDQEELFRSWENRPTLVEDTSTPDTETPLG